MKLGNNKNGLPLHAIRKSQANMPDRSEPTALNVALNAIENLKVTASSHQRTLLVKVMGRKCGYLALMAGVAGGPEAAVLPDFAKLTQ